MVLIRHFFNLTFIIWREKNLIFSLCSTEECQDGLDINNENNDNFNEWTEWTASLIKGKESLKSAVSKSAAPNVIYVHDVMM